MKNNTLQFLIGFLCLIGLSTSQAFAQVNHAIAWVWADDHDNTDEFYTPNLSYQFNSSEAVNTAKRVGVGAYAVTFTGLANNDADNLGAVMVNGYGDDAHCMVREWGPIGDDLSVSVLCFDSAGELVDSQFNAMFYQEEGLKPFANSGYAFITGSGDDGFQLDPSGSWNSEGKAVTFSVIDEERFSFKFKGMNAEVNYNAQVTKLGNIPGYCFADSVSQDSKNQGTVKVDVRCISPDDKLKLNPVMVNLFGKDGTGLDVDNQTLANAYTTVRHDEEIQYLDTFHSNSGGFSGEAEHQTGVYQVNISEIKASNKSTVFVSNIMSDGYCTIKNWLDAAEDSGVNVNVRCYNTAGEPMDTDFSLIYFTDEETTRTVNVEGYLDYPSAHLSVYPNPFNSSITLSEVPLSAGGIVRIFNVLGRQVYDSPVLNQQLDLSHLSNGLYFLTVYDSGGNLIKTKPIVKR